MQTITGSSCSISDCDKKVEALGWCALHYRRWINNGSADHVKQKHRPHGDLSKRNELGEKFCPKCEQWVDVSGFWKTKKSSDGLCYYCSDCVRRDARRSKYKIDIAEYLSEADFKCGICQKPIEERSAHVDHDHSCCSGSKTCGGCVRGVLCMHCNKGLGFFKDNSQNLINAVKYLEQSKK